ncbi:MAG: hypothetical protein Tsb0016_25600 [Sphingomonadales bacterium]
MGTDSAWLVVLLQSQRYANRASGRRRRKRGMRRMWQRWINKPALALVALAGVLMAGEAAAKCYGIADDKASFKPLVKFNFCNDGPSGLRFSPTEIAKHPAIAARSARDNLAIRIEAPSLSLVLPAPAGWGGRGWYGASIEDVDQATSLAKAVNAGQVITITVADQASGDDYEIFAGAFNMTFPAAMLPADGEGAAAPAQSQQAQAAPAAPTVKPYPVADLPAALTDVALIPFAPGQEEAWRQDYLNGLNARFIDKACEATAFPYRRAQGYWYQVDNALETANHKAPKTLNRQSAAALCADQAAAQQFRSQLLHHPQRAFDRLCALLDAPAAFREPNLLTVKAGAFETACYDLGAIRADARNQCLRGYMPNISAAQKPAHCDCVGDRVAAHFAGGEVKFNSKTSVQAATQAQQFCRGQTQGKPPAKAHPAKAEAATPQPAEGAPQSPAPAQAEPDNQAEKLKDQAGDAVNKAAEKIKKGFGGLFK